MLKDCPFCASANVEVDSSDTIDNRRNEFVVWCKNCGCFGPNGLTVSDARILWNLRRPMAHVAHDLNEIIKMIEKYKEVK